MNIEELKLNQVLGCFMARVFLFVVLASAMLDSLIKRFVITGGSLLTCSVVNLVATEVSAAPMNCPGCDLKNSDLSSQNYLGANRTGSDLRGANLQSSDLSNVVFMGSDFRGANLRGANLFNTFFTGDPPRRSNLEGADLRGAKLNGTFFTNAILRNADLRGTQLINGSLEGADLTGAKIDATFFGSKTLLLNTTLPDGRVYSTKTAARKNGPVFVNSRCRLSSKAAGGFRVDYKDTFSVNSRDYLFFVARYGDGAGIFCLSKLNYMDGSPVGFSSIQNNFVSDIKRVKGKPVYKFNIIDGNGRGASSTRYRLDMRYPNSPKIKVLR